MIFDAMQVNQAEELQCAMHIRTLMFSACGLGEHLTLSTRGFPDRLIPKTRSKGRYELVSLSTRSVPVQRTFQQAEQRLTSNEVITLDVIIFLYMLIIYSFKQT